MAIFDSLEKNTNTAVDKSEEFLKNSEAYYKLKLFQVVTSSLGMLVKFSVFSAFMGIAFIFIAIALSVLLGEWLGSSVWGYILVAVIYMLLAVLTYIYRKEIDHIIIRSLSQKFFEEDEERI